MDLKQKLIGLQYKKLNNLFIDIHNNKYVHIKGEVLSIQSYNTVGQRFTSDIDILLPKKELMSFKKILKINDFYSTLESKETKILMLSSSHQISPWIKDINPWGEINIDLNFDIFWGEYEGKRIDIDDFISDNIELEIYGCKVKALTPIKAMIQLILHHYKDMNSIFLLATRNSIQYNMFKDVYYLLKNNLNEITIEKLYSLSAEYEIIPYVFYILYYTGKVFDDDILNEYIEAFRTEDGEKLLNCYGLCESEQKEWKYDFNIRLATDNLYELIKNDLTKKDNEKIAINKRIFLGEVE